MQRMWEGDRRIALETLWYACLLNFAVPHFLFAQQLHYFGDGACNDKNNVAIFFVYCDIDKKVGYN